ncbi:MAG: hypothetical protein R3E67_07695 [Pseudomonadales bacterium]
MTELKTRLQRNRPMMTVTLRMPSDVLTDLKRIAPLLGYTGYQPLMRTYIGQGLRVDLEKLEDTTMARFVEALRHNGVSEEAIRKAIDEMAA